ncbi:MAG: YeeE/YedE family protein [Anaerolineae bacterium]|nr:YeeE/YedE family protein [Anaerolineae bacterium]MDK1080522.1 YeeE/YedE family protein [Anaerolineae bacterium]
MMTILLLAIPTGILLGYVLERGDLCFHSTLRGLNQRPRELDLFKAYLLGMLLATPLVYGLIALNVIEPWIPPFAWQANILGGTIFGIGMVIASTCVTGLFYKTGHGMLGAIIGLAGWFVGDLLIYKGPLSSIRENLNQVELTVAGNPATLANIFGSLGWVVVILAGIGIAYWLWKSPISSRGDYWNWRKLGLAVGIVIPVSWILARFGGSNYPYGTSSIPTQIVQFITNGMSGGDSPWILLTLAGIIPGAYLAARLSGTLWVRGETLRRYIELGSGGLIMGIAAGIAGGCNLGHSLIGVPLLSLGSLTTTVFMGVGVWLAHRTIRLLATMRTKTSIPEAI